jgi:ribonuclease T1
VRALLAAVGLLVGQNAVRSDFGRPHIDAVPAKVRVLEDARILDYGRLVYQGRVDVNPALDRIRRGDKLDHRNDGAYFGNYERKLPVSPRDYYREFVYTRAGIRFPGPARLVIGLRGEVYFTGDHYESFSRVNP